MVWFSELTVLEKVRFPGKAGFPSLFRLYSKPQRMRLFWEKLVLVRKIKNVNCLRPIIFEVCPKEMFV